MLSDSPQLFGIAQSDGETLTDKSSVRAAPPSLKAAVRRARLEDAERSDVVAELRDVEIARLEMLRSAIEPVLAQVPEDVDVFDVGLALGERPKLFVDMIGFVEMGRDRRQYRFMQNMRHGRVIIAESEHLDTITQAITAYIARRLIEREKALASDAFFFKPDGQPRSESWSSNLNARLSSAGQPTRAKHSRTVRRAVLATFELLGSLVLILIVAAAVWFAWRFIFAWWSGAP